MRVFLVGVIAVAVLFITGPGSATAAPPWSEEVSVATASIGSGASIPLSVVANARGDAAVFWWEADPLLTSVPVLRAATRVAHGAWSVPRTLLASPGHTTGNELPKPAASISPSGELSVVLEARLEATSPSGVYEIRGSAGGDWGLPVRVSVEGRGVYRMVSAADAQSGRIVAAWQDLGTTSSPVTVATRTATGLWSTPVAVGPEGSEQTVAIRGTTSMVAWSRAPNPADRMRNVEAAVDTGDGAWRQESVDTLVIRPRSFIAAIDASGTAAVGWVAPYSDYGKYLLWVARRGPNGWLEPSRLGYDVRSDVSLVVPASGRLTAGYTDTAAATAELGEDGRWSVVQLSNPTGATTGSAPGGLHLATDELGNMAASWGEQRPSGGNNVNWVRSRPAGAAAWTPPVKVAGPIAATLGVYSDPLVAVSGDAPLAVWFFTGSNAWGPRGVALRWVDRKAPTLDVRRPVDREQVLVGGPLRARFACSDEQYGSGLAPATGCVAKVERPDGSTYSVVEEQLFDVEEAGTYTVTFTARDQAGNTSTEQRRYVVVTSFPPDPGTDPGPGTGPDPGTNPNPGTGPGTGTDPGTNPNPNPNPGTDPPGLPPGVSDPPPTPPTGDLVAAPPPGTIPFVPGPGLTPPASGGERRCEVRGVKLLAVLERGRGAGGQIRIVGIAPHGWAGKRVDVRFGARRIARTSIRRDGTIQLTVRRPSGSRNGAYRLAVGRALSNRMKVSRGSAVPPASAACR